MRFRIGDKVRVLDGEKISEYTQGWNMPEFIGDIVTINDYEQYSDGRVAYRVKENYYTFDERGLEPVDADGGKIAYAPNGAPLFWKPEPEKPVSIEEQLGLPKGIVSIHDIDTHEVWTTPFIIPKDKLDALIDAWAKLGCTTFNLVPDEVKEVIKKTEEKKMPTKFTFYTVDTSRINKTNNTKVDTVMTCVHIGDKVGYATCDKEDYDEREGILNAIANLCCDGSFDKAYRKAVKEKKISETLDRTCSYCRKVFDTVAEREAHEAWHIERRKARRERYLLRKRAKEIAFEEQAQKMAKEMIKEDK